MRRYWTISVSARAVQSLYALPRGVAGQVTDGIDKLLNDPTPEDAEPVEGLTNVYRLVIAEHIVEYEIVIDKQTIKILNVA